SVSFFFSSRRRHTRSKRDWSSDVCSSDLPILAGVEAGRGLWELRLQDDEQWPVTAPAAEEEEPAEIGVGDELDVSRFEVGQHVRSEERRVGKEWRGGGAAGQARKAGACKA